MENYIHTIYLKSSDMLREGAIESLSVLLYHDKGIENYRISSDGVYLEYNTYLYTQDQIEDILYRNGFKKRKDRRLGFIRRQIRNLAESNKKTYGNRKPDCCQTNE
jgi:hypothetical protein